LARPKTVSKHSPAQNPNATKEWVEFCRETWGLDDNVASDAFSVYAFLDELKKVDKGESFKIISHSANRAFRKCGVILSFGSKNRIDNDRVEYYLNLLSLPKQG
jgi:hypothetical protein